MSGGRYRGPKRAHSQPLGKDFLSILDEARAEFARQMEMGKKKTGRPKKGAKSPLEAQGDELALLEEFV